MRRETRFSRPYRILLADDHPLVRRGVKALLQSEPDIEICGEVSDGRSAVEMAKVEKPNLVLVDLTMPEMEGLAVTRAIVESCPDTTVFILTMHFAEPILRQIVASGARGCVLKSEADSELLAAINDARHSRLHFCSALTHIVLEFISRRGDGRARPPEGRLTTREAQVLKLLGLGNSNKIIASSLGISLRTVENHRAQVMRKMHFQSFSQLLRFAIDAEGPTKTSLLLSELGTRGNH